MESKSYDLLFFSGDKEISHIIGEEAIYYTNKIIKISSFSIKQERNIILTNEAIYILQNKKYKRKMKYGDVHGISFSTISNEFIIHGEKEYDLHFLHQDKETIIYIIIKCYETVVKKPLILCEIDEKNLKSYVTTKKDKKRDNKLSKMDETKSIDTQTYIIDNDPGEKNKRSHTETVGGKTNFIQNINIIEESPQKIIVKILFTNDENIQTLNYKDFIFIKIVGRGNISKTILVQYKKNQKYYALKSIPKNMIEKYSSAKEKVKIIQKLNHPFLIKAHFCFETNDRIYFAFSYIQGEELSYHIKTHKNLKEENVKFYAGMLILLLDYLHNNGIIYRNFTPNNIIIDKEGYIKLTPFHIEEVFEIKKEICEKIEKNEYNSPEFLADNKEKLKGADWWNLGVIIFEMIYGIPPFYVEEPDKIKDYINNTRLKIPKEPIISQDCKDLINKLLNKSFEERIGYKNGLEDFKKHCFFKDFNFDYLLEKKIESPYKPSIGDILENNKKIEEKYTYEDLINIGLIKTS